MDNPLIFGRFRQRLARRPLREAADHFRQTIAAGRTFTCLLADDAELQRLNREFLQNDYPTDVLSFPAPSGSLELGDLAISIDRAAEQAATLGHTVPEEVQILMLHGLLHLLGHDHERDGGEMARVEQRWREQLGLPAGLIERTTV